VKFKPSEHRDITHAFEYIQGTALKRHQQPDRLLQLGQERLPELEQGHVDAALPELRQAGDPQAVREGLPVQAAEHAAEEREGQLQPGTFSEKRNYEHIEKTDLYKFNKKHSQVVSNYKLYARILVLRRTTCSPSAAASRSPSTRYFANPD